MAKKKRTRNKKNNLVTYALLAVGIYLLTKSGKEVTTGPGPVVIPNDPIPQIPADASVQGRRRIVNNYLTA